MYLLDTDVLSELKKISAGRADSNVFAWSCRTSSSDHFISAITILEVRRGILQLQRNDREQASQLQRWLDGQVLEQFATRVLPFDLRAALVCATLHVPDPRPERDAMIAATALVHGLIVVTRNVKDFRPMNVSLVNPRD